jgi:hypothetical protein
MFFYRVPILAMSMACSVINSSDLLAQGEARSEIARESATASQAPREPRQAQTSPVDRAQTEVPSEFGETVVIQKQAAFDPWRVDVDVQAYHTDNVALAPRRVEDWFFRTGVEVSYLNRITDGWNAEFFLGQDFIRYDRFDALDFDITKAGAGVSAKLNWLGGATFLARYQFEYLADPGWSGRILSSHSVTAGLFKTWRLSSSHRVYAGLLVEPDLAVDPSISLRHENAVHAGWSMRLTERLTARVSGRAAYHSSPNADRQDWNYLAKLSAIYELTPWASLTASSSLMWNHSSKDRFDYRNQLTGAALGIELQF